MRMLVTDEEVNCSKYDKVVKLSGSVDTCYLDCRGVSFDILSTLLYVEKEQVKAHGMTITYDITSMLILNELGHFNDEWRLRAYKVNSNQEVIIYGKINENHPNLYCLKKE